MRILAEDTMLLVIDFQEKLMPVMYNEKDLIANTSKLIEGLKVLDVPIIVTQQYTKGLGRTIEELKTQIGEKFSYYDKLAFSCAEDNDILNAIKKINKKNIIVCGIEAHICVLQTVIDLIELGYNVILIQDCIGSRTKKNMKIAIQRAIFEGTIISSYESILFELTRKAGTDTFKTISKIIK